MFNRDFAQHDKVFRKACELAGVQPSKRQASRWKQGRGQAKRFEQNARLLVPQEVKKA